MSSPNESPCVLSLDPGSAGLPLPDPLARPLSMPYALSLRAPQRTWPRRSKQRQQILYVLRAFEEARVTGLDHAEDDVGVVSHLNGLALHELCIFPQERDYTTETWYALYCHLMLANSAVLYPLRRDGSDASPLVEPEEWVDRRLARVNDLVRTRAAATHPGLAENVLAHLGAAAEMYAQETRG